MGRAQIAEVDVYLGGIVFSVLVRGEAVVPPYRRGEQAVRITDARLNAEVERAAVDAAAEAARRGWLA